MGFTFAITPEAMFEDRAGEFIGLGVSPADVGEMRAAITDMWSDELGGWAHEWSRLARRYAEAGQPYKASLAYGCAKFPCLANAARSRALADQRAAYLDAAPSFPVKFERREIATPFGAGQVAIPVHLYSNVGSYADAPVLLANGGVDTWKMDTHALFVAFARRLGVTVMAFDQPGTGEHPAPLVPEADTTVLALADEARRLGNGRVAHFGMSFGANYSAMTALMGAVDASVVLGGPVDKAFERANLDRLPYGMAGIIGNAVGFDQEPTADAFAAAAARLSRRTLLDRPSNAPMLVINGADDYFVPQADTRVFEGRPDTEVHLIEGTGHCAFSKLPQVIARVLEWLPKQIG